MNGLALLGLILIVYAALVVYIAVKKPDKIWNMKKIEAFKKVLGENGTVYFFYFWALAALAVGIWLLVK